MHQDFPTIYSPPLIPISPGIAGGFAAYTAGVVAPHIPRRVLLIGGQILPAVACVLYALADTPAKYWSHVLPGMIVGMIGLATGYVGATISIMAGAREGQEVCYISQSFVRWFSDVVVCSFTGCCGRSNEHGIPSRRNDRRGK